MIKSAKEIAPTVSAIFIAISAIHLVAASIYLYFYCLGFGANISLFYSAPDIFSISITKLSNVYFRSLAFPAIIWGAFYIFRVKNSEEWIKAAPTPDDVERRRRADKRLIAFMLWTGWLTVLITGSKLGWDWLHGRVAPFSYPVLSALSFAVLMTTVNRIGYAPSYMWLVGFFLTGLVGGALDNGQLDRHATYNSSHALPACQSFKVMGRASSYFLAIGNQDTKVLLKEDCKVAFVLPRPSIS